MGRTVLRDGAAVEVRQIRGGDKALLTDTFAHLGPQSRYQRFLSPLKRLSTGELAYLTDIDHHDHEALLAIDSVSGRAVGVARFVRSARAPHAAEVAIAVIDSWQCRGVGTVLLHQLAERAREEGVTHFTALVLAGNRAILDLLHELGPLHRTRQEAGTAELEIDLPATPDEARRVLRAAGPAAAQSTT